MRVKTTSIQIFPEKNTGEKETMSWNKCQTQNNRKTTFAGNKEEEKTNKALLFEENKKG